MHVSVVEREDDQKRYIPILLLPCLKKRLILDINLDTYYVFRFLARLRFRFFLMDATLNK